MGKLVVFEGLDGSGKATQAKLLYCALKAEGQNVMLITFPNYDSPSSALVKMYLSGEFGKRVEDVNAYTASLFYSVDRFASYKKSWGEFYNNGGIIIADRYTTSNAVHQCSKTPKNQWDSYLEWLFKTEYELMGIPRPDVVFYLNVHPDISQKLMYERYKGEESKKDIHEKDIVYLKMSYDAAMYCVKKYNWVNFNCTKNGEMRGIDDIHFELVKNYKTLMGSINNEQNASDLLSKTAFENKEEF